MAVANNYQLSNIMQQGYKLIQYNARLYWRKLFMRDKD